MKSIDESKPHLIITVGIPGAGKSFFAEHFADTFKAPIVSFDKLRKEIFYNPSFSDDEDDILFKVSNHILDEVLKTKRTVIYEGRTDTRVDRGVIAKKARELGYEPLFIWVQTEPVSAKHRATKPNVEKPSISSERFDHKVKQFKAPHQNERVVVISGKHTYASQLKIVLKHLVGSRIGTDKQNTVIKQPVSRNFLIR